MEQCELNTHPLGYTKVQPFSYTAVCVNLSLDVSLSPLLTALSCTLRQQRTNIYLDKHRQLIRCVTSREHGKNKAAQPLVTETARCFMCGVCVCVCVTCYSRRAAVGGRR